MTERPVVKIATTKKVSRRGQEVASAIVLRRLQRIARSEGVTLLDAPRLEVFHPRFEYGDPPLVVGSQRGYCP